MTVQVTPELLTRWLLDHRLLARQLATGIQARRGYWARPHRPNQPLPVLLFSQVAWDDVWQRPQELARGLAKNRPVLYCSPVQVHQTAGQLRGRWRLLRQEENGRLLVLCPQILSGEYRSLPLRRINQRIILQALLPFLRRRPFIFLTNTPFADFVREELRPRFSGYDLIDDFCAFQWAPAEGRSCERRLLRKADFATAGTYALFDKFRPRFPAIEFAPSGIDFNKLTKPTKEPSDLRRLRKPRLLYVGTLNDRISGELIYRTAKAFPDASIVLIGPRRATFSAPSFPDNVHELGLKPHDELPGYYQHCDVGLMPFANNEAARAINPVKTLEYLSCGLPVISTPIPDVERFYAPPVIVAKPNQWRLCIAEMLSEGKKARAMERQAFARGRSWDNLVDTVEAKLQEFDYRTA